MFEWDRNKAASNLAKHGVSFEEAQTAFDDPYALTFPDVDGTVAEERSLTIGYSERLRLLLVVSTERGDNIRIISARRATSREKASYERSI